MLIKLLIIISVIIDGISSKFQQIILKDNIVHQYMMLPQRSLDGPMQNQFHLNKNIKLNLD